MYSRCMCEKGALRLQVGALPTCKRSSPRRMKCEGVCRDDVNAHHQHGDSRQGSHYATWKLMSIQRQRNDGQK